MRRTFAAVALLLILGVASITFSAENLITAQNDLILRHIPIDKTITYQGLLKNSSGDPVPDASYNLTFRIYNGPSGGSALWISSATPVTTVGGYFTTQLGPVPLPFDTTYYLSLQVQSDPEMATRQKMTIAPYSASSDTANSAFHADTSGVAQNVVDNCITSAKIVNGTISFSDISQNGAANGQVMKWNGSAWVARNDSIGGGSGNGWADDGSRVRLISSSDSVGIGTSSPNAKLQVQGNIFVTDKATIGPSNYNSGINAFCVGANNSTYGDYSTIAGGWYNVAGGISSHVGGGYSNSAGGISSNVSGENNFASADWSTIAGGSNDTTFGGGSVIAGGEHNKTTNILAVIGGGFNNLASNQYSTVGGGTENTASGEYSTVGGGYGNRAGSNMSVIAGGRFDTTFGYDGAIAGGFANAVTGDQGAIGGGEHNRAGGSFSVVSGGEYNFASGGASAIPGGAYDTITTLGSFSLAFGYEVYVNSGNRVNFFNGVSSGRLGLNRDDRDGGVNYPITVGTNTGNGNGAYLSPGGVWTGGSSRTFKENFQPLDGNELLAKIANLSITSYNYKNSSEKHIGPMAEDFVGAFDTGVIRESDGQRDDQYLAPSDVAGVALAGVHELINENKQLKKDNETLKIKMDDLEKRLNELENRR